MDGESALKKMEEGKKLAYRQRIITAPFKEIRELFDRYKSRTSEKKGFEERATPLVKAETLLEAMGKAKLNEAQKQELEGLKKEFEGLREEFRKDLQPMLKGISAELDRLRGEPLFVIESMKAFADLYEDMIDVRGGDTRRLCSEKQLSIISDLVSAQSRIVYDGANEIIAEYERIEERWKHGNLTYPDKVIIERIKENSDFYEYFFDVLQGANYDRVLLERMAELHERLTRLDIEHLPMRAVAPPAFPLNVEVARAPKITSHAEDYSGGAMNTFFAAELDTPGNTAESYGSEGFGRDFFSGTADGVGKAYSHLTKGYLTSPENGFSSEDADAFLAAANRLASNPNDLEAQEKIVSILHKYPNSSLSTMGRAKFINDIRRDYLLETSLMHPADWHVVYDYNGVTAISIGGRKETLSSSERRERQTITFDERGKTESPITSEQTKAPTKENASGVGADILIDLKRISGGKYKLGRIALGGGWAGKTWEAGGTVFLDEEIRKSLDRGIEDLIKDRMKPGVWQRFFVDLAETFSSASYNVQTREDVHRHQFGFMVNLVERPFGPLELQVAYGPEFLWLSGDIKSGVLVQHKATVRLEVPKLNWLFVEAGVTAGHKQVSYSTLAGVSPTEWLNIYGGVSGIVVKETEKLTEPVILPPTVGAGLIIRFGGGDEHRVNIGAGPAPPLR